MKEVHAGAGNDLVRKDNLEQYMSLASSDSRIVAITVRPDETLAYFLTYLGGTASPTRESWPLYVCKRLIDPNWRVGSKVSIGDRNVQAPIPTGKHQRKYINHYIGEIFIIAYYVIYTN